MKRALKELRSYGGALVAVFSTKDRIDLFGAWIPAAVLIFIAFAFVFGWHK